MHHTAQAHLFRTAFRLVLLLGVCAVPIAQAQTSTVLYDQLNNLGPYGTDSDDFWDLPAWSSFAADDFVVPAGRTWTITEVDVQGQYRGQNGPADYFAIAFYQDAGGLPGTLVYSARGERYFNDAGLFQVTLRRPAVLTSGTYWVSVQARLSINNNGTWWWMNRAMQVNSPAAWQNPNGGSGHCVTWGVRADCLYVGQAVGPDQAFRIKGTTMTTFNVSNANDSGTGSLRQALAEASDGDKIYFDPSLTGQTITLASGELLADKSVTITGPGASQLSVNGNAAGRVFHIAPGKTVTMSGLGIVNGIAPAPNRWGGGIYNDHATLTLNDCTISGNSADQGSGGGIFNDGAGSSATLTINDSTISGNSAWPGGGIFNYDGSVMITNSTLSGNSDNGSNYGGAIVNLGVLTITNSTVTGNSAAAGGAIYNWQGSTLTITNSTFSDNFCNNPNWIHGGGIYNEDGTVNIGSTIFKAGPAGENIYHLHYLGGGVTSLGHNLSSDDGGGLLTAAGDKINTDPKLGPLQNNGGRTLTHLPQADSPAIDAGDPALGMDQRGADFQRVVNGVVDIGAAEVQPTPTPDPIPTPTPSPTPTSTTGPTTPTPNPSPTALATATPTATATVTATATPTATATATATATSTPRATPSATPTPDSHLANVSTRMRVGAGDDVLIAGFVIQGNDNKRLIVRGIAPSLSAFGIEAALQDPSLQLFRGNTELSVNDNWSDNPNAAEIVSTGLAPTDAKESALVVTLAPGSYTALLRGKDGATGVGLIEVYDLDVGGPAKVVNISTRGYVLTGDNGMIGGFIVTGNDPSQLVIRAIGPSLNTFGVPNPLTDPFLEIHDGNGAMIQTNNNWRDSQEAALQNTGLAPSDDLEAAILISLMPGGYTAIVKGADGGVGNGLVEIYKLSP